MALLKWKWRIYTYWYEKSTVAHADYGELLKDIILKPREAWFIAATADVHIHFLWMKENLQTNMQHWTSAEIVTGWW